MLIMLNRWEEYLGRSRVGHVVLLAVLCRWMSHRPFLYSLYVVLPVLFLCAGPADH